MDVVVKGERAVVGDCVLLSCGDSERMMRVRDVDGCQIRLNGVVRVCSMIGARFWFRLRKEGGLLIR